MSHFLIFLRSLLTVVLSVGLCLICADVVLAAPTEISLSEEEADYLIRSAAFAAKGSMHIHGRKDTRPAASYAARVGIIATVLNRMDDPRFPDSIPYIIASDRTFSPAAPAAALSEYDLELTRSALEAALQGFDPTGGALYFSTPAVHCNRFAVTCEFGGYSFGVPEK